MKIIIKVISGSMQSFAYLGILLLIFLMIYSLFGMSIYAYKFNFPDNSLR